MPSPEHELYERYPESVESVRAFLRRFFGDDLDESVDAENDALIFAIGPARRISVSADFLAEYNAEETYEKLTGWNVANLSQTLEARTTLEITAFGLDRISD